MNEKQVMSALAKANEIRYARADLKRDIRAGKTTVAEVLADPPDYIDTMPIGELICAQPRWGRSRLAKMLDRYCRGLSDRREVGKLTERQRRALADEVGQSIDPRKRVAA